LFDKLSDCQLFKALVSKSYAKALRMTWFEGYAVSDNRRFVSSCSLLDTVGHRLTCLPLDPPATAAVLLVALCFLKRNTKYSSVKLVAVPRELLFRSASLLVHV